jgi:hypothetical protein
LAVARRTYQREKPGFFTRLFGWTATAAIYR